MRRGVLRRRVDAAAWTVGCAGAAGTLATTHPFWLTAGILTASGWFLIADIKEVWQ